MDSKDELKESDIKNRTCYYLMMQWQLVVLVLKIFY